MTAILTEACGCTAVVHIIEEHRIRCDLLRRWRRPCRPSVLFRVRRLILCVSCSVLVSFYNRAPNNLLIINLFRLFVALACAVLNLRNKQSSRFPSGAFCGNCAVSCFIVSSKCTSYLKYMLFVESKETRRGRLLFFFLILIKSLYQNRKCIKNKDHLKF